MNKGWSQKWWWGNDTCMQKNEIPLYTRIKMSWRLDTWELQTLNWEFKTGIKLHGIGLRDDILDMTPNAQAMKFFKSGIFIPKSFCIISEKETYRLQRINVIELVIKSKHEFIELNILKSNFIKNGKMCMNRHFIYTDYRHIMRRCSMSLTMEIQIEVTMKNHFTTSEWHYQKNVYMLERTW